MARSIAFHLATLLIAVAAGVFLYTQVWADEHAGGLPSWQYLTIQVNVNRDTFILTSDTTVTYYENGRRVNYSSDWLQNKVGSHGWELVAVTSNRIPQTQYISTWVWTYFFKRRVGPDVVTVRQMPDGSQTQPEDADETTQ